MQVGRQALGRLRVPVVGVLDVVPRRLDDLDHRRREPHGVAPVVATRQGRPRRARSRRRRALGVVHPHLPLRAAVGDGRVEEVALHRRGDDRALPLEERRDGEPGGLAAAARAEDGEGGLGLAGEEPTVRPPDGHPARQRARRTMRRLRWRRAREAGVGPVAERPGRIVDPLPRLHRQQPRRATTTATTDSWQAQ